MICSVKTEEGEVKEEISIKEEKVKTQQKFPKTTKFSIPYFHLVKNVANHQKS